MSIIRILLYFTLILSSQILYSQQDWFQIPSPSNYPLSGIYFKNFNSGVVGGYKTTNGGQTWLVPNINNDNYSLSFPDSNTGYLIGHVYFYKTTNFGNDWLLLNRPNGLFFGTYFCNIYTGYVCGSKIIKTTNGGLNWTIQPIPLSQNYELYNIFFTDLNNGFAVGSTYTGPPDSSVIIKTTNGGISWNVQSFYSPVDRYLHSIYFITPNTGFLGGKQYIYKTTDAGSTWLYKSSMTSNIINSIYFPNNLTGFGVCNYGDIIKTTNAGDSWFKQNSLTSNDLLSVYFINNNYGYISGVGNKILKTTNGGGPPIGIRPMNNEMPKSFELYQNFPNPFNPTTKINYDLPKDAKVSIIFYDILGRQMLKLVNDEFQKAGKYSLTFNGQPFASGVYFYRLVSDKYVEVKKMLLIK